MPSEAPADAQARPAKKPTKQAVVILHGMGEQIPMQTLESFVDAVWTQDESLVSRGKPDPDTGRKRARNAFWAKPDAHNDSFELRVITTEAMDKGGRVDFYEYYWAHLMEGTTWEHVKAWIFDLLWRDPARRVPRRLLAPWVALWAVALTVGAVSLIGATPARGEATPSLPASLAMWIGGLLLAVLVSNVLIKRIGDVARYVKARPANVARRQEIRAKGVELLDRLTASGEYGRIVVVGHSLGAIIAYDVLTQLFVRHNARFAPQEQPRREALEAMIRVASGAPDQTAPPPPLDLDAYQELQSAALAEAQEQGFSWIVTDFVTLGAPLTHAEFLMAESRADLRARQTARILPTCPPALEYDGKTKMSHISYAPDPGSVRLRRPHHAALFAYTRWTNLYSDHRSMIMGDLVSGPVAEIFGLETNGATAKGIRDVAVLPALDAEGAPLAGHSRSLFTHNAYWDAEKGTENVPTATPHHIAELRKALALLARKP